MEVIEILEKFNGALEQSFIFRSIKVLLAFYLIVIVLVLLGILFRIGKTYWVILIAGQEFPVIAKGKFQKKWDEIQELVGSDDSRTWKIAVLEAAQLLDEVLKTAQYNGENLGERLDGIVEVQLRNLSQVKEANKIKNRIVQDDGYDLSKEESQKIVEIFGDSLRFFEVIN